MARLTIEDEVTAMTQTHSTANVCTIARDDANLRKWFALSGTARNALNVSLHHRPSANSLDEQ